MAEVFISYARASEGIAKRVESALEGAGHKAWRDDQLPAHEAYGKIIEQRLQGADVVVVLWSEEAAQSEWVRAEADFARSHRKLVQAQLDDTLPPLPFNQIQCADLRGWRGHRNHKGWVKLASSVASVASGEHPTAAETVPIKARFRLTRRGALAAVALLFLIVAGAVLLRPVLTTNKGPPKIAVLPFEGVGASDAALVEGIWEDTRQALSRNPQLLVLGPNTSEEITQKGSVSARKAADFLLQASVRTAGDRVRISTSLSRSRDGAQIWSQTFDRKLDDVFALQAQIAQEIEGRVRGRLAREGGKVPENISTSGEVYALYSDARATIRDRGDFEKAHRQLQRAVEIDPNFAPAWAALAITQGVTAANLASSASTGRESEAFARRAIALAPNLAAGHAALAFALGQGPVAEAALRRAVVLDPSDVESMTWLASVEADHGRWSKALELYDRVLQVEPLWWPAVLNRLNLWFDLEQHAAVEKELERVDRLRNRKLSAFAHMAVSEWRGDLSEAARAGLEFRRDAAASERAIVDDWLASLLLRLDHDEIAWKLSNAPPNASLMWRNDPRGFAIFESRRIPPAMFWKISPMAEVVSSAYVRTRREAKVLQLYQGAAATPDDFLRQVEWRERFLYLAPIVAVAFQRTGQSAEADRLNAAVEKVLGEPAKTRINLREEAIATARLRAVQGRRADAIAALREAVDRGWWPEAPYFRPDIEEDPPLGLLKNAPEFQQIRARVIAHLRKERDELGRVQIDPVRTSQAA